MRQDLQSVLASLRQMPAEQLPELLGELEVVRATAMMRLTSPPVVNQHDSLLSIEDAANRLGMSVKWLYANHPELPFARKQGKRILFSERGIDQYISRGRR